MACFATGIGDYINVVSPMLSDVTIFSVDYHVINDLNDILFVDIKFELFNFCQCVINEFDLNWY